MNSRRSISRKRRRGAMLLLLVIMLLGFMCAVAFSIDIAFMHLTRTELRTASDAAAKAAAIELATTFDRDQAVAKGQRIAALNSVAADPLLLASGDFVFGRSTEQSGGAFFFTPNDQPFNTVRVNGRRTAGSPSGPIPLFFGNVLGFPFFEPQLNSSATFIARDIVLVVDRSGSMAGRKFAALQGAIDLFVDTLDQTPVDEFVGLASYSHTVSEDVQLTTNLQDVSAGMRNLVPLGFTNISGGMRAGERIINRTRAGEVAEQTMIVMTDGRHNFGANPVSVAQRIAAANNMQIHTITFGAGADQRRMRQVARIGGGDHFHAVTGEQLRQIYEDIARTLSTVISE